MIAILWVAFIVFIFLLPPYKSSVPWADEFSWEALNYAPILVGGALILFGGWYLLSAHKWFKGPVRMGTEEELERLEEETARRTSTSRQSAAPPRLVRPHEGGAPAGAPPSYASSAARNSGSAAVRSMRSKCSAA